MAVSPFEIERREFGRSFTGYKQSEVDTFLDEVRITMTELWQERGDLREEVERLSERLTRFSQMEEQLKNTLLLAQDSADKSQEQARREAEIMLTEAGQKARDIVHEAHAEQQRLESSLRNLHTVEKETRTRFRQLAEAVIANLNQSEAAADKSATTLRAAVEDARAKVEAERSKSRRPGPITGGQPDDEVVAESEHVGEFVEAE